MPFKDQISGLKEEMEKEMPKVQSPKLKNRKHRGYRRLPYITLAFLLYEVPTLKPGSVLNMTRSYKGKLSQIFLIGMLKARFRKYEAYFIFHVLGHYSI